MKRANFKVELSEALIKEKQQMIEELTKDKIVLEYLKKNHLKIDFIEENAYLLKDYVACLSKCQGCKGLAFCTQDTQGNTLNLISNGDDVHKEITKCDFALEKESKLYHTRQLVINDMSEDQLMNSFQTTDLTEESVNYIKLYKELMIETIQRTREGFFLCGDPGVGKTYLASCFMNEMAIQQQSCSFVHVPSMVANLKTMMFDHQAFRRQILGMKKCDVLILDDIGGESASSWSRDDILLPLLNERMEKGMQTIFTSNYSMDKLEKFYTLKSKAVNDTVGANRLIERVKSLAKERILIGNNRRVKNGRN